MSAVIAAVPSSPGLSSARLALPSGRALAVAAAAALALLVGIGLWLSPLGGRGGDGPPLSLEGGGFVFNYRIAEVTYGLVARLEREVPAGTRVVASFENPAGGPPLVVEQTTRPGLAKLMLRSPPVAGVVKDRPYQVVVRLLDPASGEELGRLETSMRSNVDQSVMPERPLTIGPGYQRPAVP